MEADLSNFEKCLANLKDELAKLKNWLANFENSLANFKDGLVNLKDGLPNSEMEWSNEYMGLPVVRKKERKQNKGITLNILLAKLKSW